MNFNVASQNQGVVAYSKAASASPAIDIRQHINFSFTFKVLTTLAADAVFKVQAAPPSTNDPCVAGVFAEVEEVPLCMTPWGATPAATSTITIPSGTPAGTVCTATLPCKPNAFVKVLPVSGGDPVEVVAILSGPR